MRSRPFTIGVLALLLALRCSERDRPPLNVILITLDTTRADHLGCYGGRSGASPAIDRLASRSVRFEQTDAAAPLTLPSHATLLTGLLPQRHGLRLNGVGSLRLSVETLATVFARRGFHTAAFVGSCLLDHRFGLGRGFGVYDDAVRIDAEGRRPSSPEAERPAGAVADAALSWLRETGDHPFFVWVHFYDAHAPYAPPEPYRSRFATAPYDGEIAYVDSQVARILAFLDQSRLRERTIVAIVGDHGEGLGEHDESTHGLLLYESTLRVPLIIAAPSLQAAVVHEAVSAADVPPTLAALAGVPMNVVRLDGRDLSADLRSRREPAPRGIYAETEYPRAFGWSDLHTFRRDGKKLISGTGDELFNLERDAHETTNIVDRDRRTYRELAAALVPLRQGASSPTAAEAARRVPAARVDPRSMTAAFRQFEEATTLISRGKAQEAIATLESLVKQDANNAGFRTTLAHAYDATGDRVTALRLYREAVALTPDNADAWYDLAGALQASGDSKEARTAIDEALRRDPNHPEAHNMRGLILARDGDRPAAAEEFRRAIAIDPRNARAYNNLGDALRDLGYVDEALNAYRRAAALAPRYAEPRDSARALVARPGR